MVTRLFWLRSVDYSYPCMCCAFTAHIVLRRQTAQKPLRSLEWLSSLTPAFCSVTPGRILKALAAGLTSHNIPICCDRIHCFALMAKVTFTPSQHGHRTSYSWKTQLILFIHKISSSSDKGRVIECIFLDLSKAFDKVSHHLLLPKLSTLNIDPNI